MENTQIEKLDKSNYNMLFWMTVGFSLFFGATILTEFLNENVILVVVRLLGLIGWLFYLKSSIISIRINKQVKKDPRLKEALNNEMHKMYAFKSYRIGFWVFLLSIAFFIFLSFFAEISSRVSLEIILYLGVLSSFISGLIFNKN